jgi:hypothetical protein
MGEAIPLIDKLRDLREKLLGNPSLDSIARV